MKRLKKKERKEREWNKNKKKKDIEDERGEREGERQGERYLFRDKENPLSSNKVNEQRSELMHRLINFFLDLSQPNGKPSRPFYPLVTLLLSSFFFFLFRFLLGSLYPSQITRLAHTWRSCKHLPVDCLKSIDLSRLIASDGII